MVDRRILFVLVALALVISPAYAASFETDQLLIKTLVKSGESITTPVKITNTDFNSDSFSVTSSQINDLQISESKFNLDPGQTKNIDLYFRSQPNSPGVITGKLNVVSGSKRVTLPLVFEVESRNVLFDANINAPPEYKEVFPGTTMLFDIRLFNLKSMETERATVTYIIKDLSNRNILTELNQ